jgi:hypothetical protein
MCPKTNSTKSVENAAPKQSVLSTPFESLLTLQQAAGIIPRVNGRRFTSSTIWRWCRKGVHGVHLDHVRMGRAILTSKPALNRFFIEVAKTQRLDSGNSDTTSN